MVFLGRRVPPLFSHRVPLVLSLLCFDALSLSRATTFSLRSSPETARPARRYTLIAGYLLIGSRERPRFKTRFFVVEEPTAEAPELRLSVYKTAACAARLNAIATKR